MTENEEPIWVVKYDACPVCAEELQSFSSGEIAHSSTILDEQEVYKRECRAESYAHFLEKCAIYRNHKSINPVQTVSIQFEDDDGGIDRLVIEYRYRDGYRGGRTRPAMDVYMNGTHNYEFHHVIKQFDSLDDIVKQLDRLSHFK